MHEALSVSVSAGFPKCTSIAVGSCSNRALERCYGVQVADETRTLIRDPVHETRPRRTSHAINTFSRPLSAELRILTLFYRTSSASHEEHRVERNRYRVEVDGIAVRVFCCSLEQALEQAELLEATAASRVVAAGEGEFLEVQSNLQQVRRVRRRLDLPARCLAEIATHRRSLPHTICYRA